jgi:hypothetical protein
MGFLLGLGGMNSIIFLVCSVIGYLAGRFLPEGAWATYTSILVSYHLFLAWLVVTSSKKTGLAMPIFSTILTHLACLALVVGVAMGRHYIPFFGLIRYLIPAIAPFERDWLFSEGRKKEEVPDTETATDTAALTAAATGEDYEAWLHHLAKRSPSSVKAGTTVKQEYEQFIAARIRNRPVVPSSDVPA